MHRDVQRLDTICAETAIRLRGLCSHLPDHEFERFVLEVALKTLCFDLGLGPRAEAELRVRLESTLKSGEPLPMPRARPIERETGTEPPISFSL